MPPCCAAASIAATRLRSSTESLPPAFESATGTIFIRGYGVATGVTTIAISGAYATSTGTATAFIGGLDVSTFEVELYISGIE